MKIYILHQVDTRDTDSFSTAEVYYSDVRPEYYTSRPAAEIERDTLNSRTRWNRYYISELRSAEVNAPVV